MQSLLRRVSIYARLQLITALGFLAIAALGSVALIEQKDLLYEQRRESLREQVETAMAVVADYHQRFQQGELTEAEAQRGALHMVRQLRYDEGRGYFWINDLDARVVMHPIKPELDGRDMAGETDAAGMHHWRAFAQVAKEKGGGFVTYVWEHVKTGVVDDKVSYVEGFKPWGWVIGSGALYTDLDELFERNMIDMIVFCLGFAVVMVAVSLMFARSITHPLRATTELMAEISTGGGDLTQRLPTGGRDELTALAGAFNRYTQRIQEIVRQVRRSTDEMSGASQELSAVVQSTHRGLDRQESETHQVASAVTEMSATVKEIARSAEEAASAAHGADQNAKEGQGKVAEVGRAIEALADDVDRTVDVIQRLNAESDAIGGVLDVIRGVAEQTNLLALNAAIEAARAGEQGRGFAVVADEVRSLASRTEQSTKEIQAMTERLREGVAEAVSAIENSRETTGVTLETGRQAAGALEEIVQAVATIRDMNAQIASAAEEQATVAHQIDENVVNISDQAKEAAENAANTDAAGERLATLSEELRTLVGRFRTE